MTCDNAKWFQRIGGTIWVTPPPTSTPPVSLTNLKYFSSFAQGPPKHLWSGYFIAVVLDKWSLES